MGPASPQKRMGHAGERVPLPASGRIRRSLPRKVDYENLGGCSQEMACYKLLPPLQATRIPASSHDANVSAKGSDENPPAGAKVLPPKRNGGKGPGGSIVGRVEANVATVLVMGSDSKLGRALYRELQTLGRVVGIGTQEIDAWEPAAVRACSEVVRPDFIVNAASFRAAESAEKAAELAYQLNAEAPGVIAAEARRCGAGMITYSSGYVFSGTKIEPYVEMDQPAPLGTYGWSHLLGETHVRAVNPAALVLRTAWMYDTAQDDLSSIFTQADELSRCGASQRLGAPTSTQTIALATLRIITRLAVIRRVVSQSLGKKALDTMSEELGGIYHLSCSGSTSLLGFAAALAHLCGKHQAMRYPLPDGREAVTHVEHPDNCVLSTTKLKEAFGLQLPDWRKALASSRLRDSQIPAGEPFSVEDFGLLLKDLVRNSAQA